MYLKMSKHELNIFFKQPIPIRMIIFGLRN